MVRISGHRHHYGVTYRKKHVTFLSWRCYLRSTAQGFKNDEEGKPQLSLGNKLHIENVHN